MRFNHLSSRYLSMTENPGILRTLPELFVQFCELQKKRPAMYTDFRAWMDLLIEWGILIPI